MAVFVGHAGLVSVAVVGKRARIIWRIGRIQVRDRNQLIRRVVGILDDISGLIRGGDDIAGAIVGVADCSSVREGCLYQTLAGVVLVLSCVAVGIGHRNLIAGVVIDVLGAPGSVGGCNEPPCGVICVACGVAERVGFALFAAVGVVGERRGARVRCAVAPSDGEDLARQIVGVVRDVPVLIGRVNNVIPEVVCLGSRGGGRVG